MANSPTDVYLAETQPEEETEDLTGYMPSFVQAAPNEDAAAALDGDGLQIKALDLNNLDADENSYLIDKELEGASLRGDLSPEAVDILRQEQYAHDVSIGLIKDSYKLTRAISATVDAVIGSQLVARAEDQESYRRTHHVDYDPVEKAPDLPNVRFSEYGNHPLELLRPEVNEDGEVIGASNYVTVDPDGRTVVIPGSSATEKFTEEQAIENYRRDGVHLGKFDNKMDAAAYRTWLVSRSRQNISLAEAEADRFHSNLAQNGGYYGFEDGSLWLLGNKSVSTFYGAFDWIRASLDDYGILGSGGKVGKFELKLNAEGQWEASGKDNDLWNNIPGAYYVTAQETAVYRQLEEMGIPPSEWVGVAKGAGIFSGGLGAAADIMTVFFAGGALKLVGGAASKLGKKGSAAALKNAARFITDQALNVPSYKKWLVGRVGAGAVASLAELTSEEVDTVVPFLIARAAVETSKGADFYDALKASFSVLSEPDYKRAAWIALRDTSQIMAAAVILGIAGGSMRNRNRLMFRKAQKASAVTKAIHEQQSSLTPETKEAGVAVVRTQLAGSEFEHTNLHVDQIDAVAAENGMTGEELVTLVTGDSHTYKHAQDTKTEVTLEVASVLEALDTDVSNKLLGRGRYNGHTIASADAESAVNRALSDSQKALAEEEETAAPEVAQEPVDPVSALSQKTDAAKGKEDAQRVAALQDLLERVQDNRRPAPAEQEAAAVEEGPGIAARDTMEPVHAATAAAEAKTPVEQADAEADYSDPFTQAADAGQTVTSLDQIPESGDTTVNFDDVDIEQVEGKPLGERSLFQVMTNPDEDPTAAFVANFNRIASETSAAPAQPARTREQFAARVAEDLAAGLGVDKKTAESAAEVFVAAFNVAARDLKTPGITGEQLYDILNLELGVADLGKKTHGKFLVRAKDGALKTQLLLHKGHNIFSQRRSGRDLIHEASHMLHFVYDSLYEAEMLNNEARGNWKLIRDKFAISEQIGHVNADLLAERLAVSIEQNILKGNIKTGDAVLDRAIGWFRIRIAEFVNTVLKAVDKATGVRIGSEVGWNDMAAADRGQYSADYVKALNHLFSEETNRDMATQAIDSYETSVGLTHLSEMATPAPEVEGETELDTADELVGREVTPISEDGLATRSVEDSVKRLHRSREQAEKAIKDIVEERKAVADELIGKLKSAGVKKANTVYKRRVRAAEERVREELITDMGFTSLSILQTGKTPAGEKVLGKQPRISSEGVDPVLVNHVNSLGKKVFFKKGISMQEASDIAGTTSPQELANLLLGITRTLDEEVRVRAEAQVEKQYGPPITETHVEQAVIDSVYSERRSRRLRLEIQAIAANKWKTFKDTAYRIAVGLPSDADVRSVAAYNVSRIKPSELRPHKYERAANAAHRRAQKAFYAGKIEDAVRFLEAEVVAIEHFRAAKRAQDALAKTFRHAKSLGKKGPQQRIGKAEHNIAEQVNFIILRITKGRDNREMLKRVAAERMSTDEFLREMYDLGFPLDPPPGVDGTLQSEGELSTGQILALGRYLRKLSAAASTINAENVESGKVERDAVAAGAIKQIDKLELNIAGQLANEQRTGLSALLDGTSAFFASHAKAEFLIKFLDGGKFGGPVWRAVFKPIADAEIAASKMHAKSQKAIAEAFDRYTPEERKALDDKILLPDGTELSRRGVLMVILNQGNAYNRQALLGGERGWNQSTVNHILAHATKKDWEVAQDIWQHLSTFWPQIKAMYRRINGVAPQAVEFEPIENEHGTWSGGYFPVVFDTKETTIDRWKADSTASVDGLFGNMSTSIYTRNGHQKARTGTGGRPILLSTAVITHHIQQVVHDLTHREAVLNVHKFLTRGDVALSTTGAIGNNGYKQLLSWVRAVAGSARPAPDARIDKIFSYVRHGSTIVGLGLRFTTMLAQTTGYAFSMKEIGVEAMGAGVAAVFKAEGGPMAALRFAQENSELMRTRISNGYDRETHDYMQRHGILATRALARQMGLSPVVLESFVKSIGVAQMLVDLPTWHGAYNKAMAGKVANVGAADHAAAVEYADHVIRMSQGSGSVKDLAAVQRGNGSDALKLFTQFYSFFSVQANQIAFEILGAATEKSKGDAIKRLAGAMPYLFMPAILDEMLKGRLPNPFGEDEEAPWEFAKAVGEEVALYPLGGYVLARELGSMFKYKTINPPTLRAMSQVASLATVPIAHVLDWDKKLTNKEIRDMVNGLGTVAHLPTDQMFITGEALYLWASGVKDWGPVEGPYRLLVGKEKK